MVSPSPGYEASLALRNLEEYHKEELELATQTKELRVLLYVNHMLNLTRLNTYLTL